MKTFEKHSLLLQFGVRLNPALAGLVLEMLSGFLWLIPPLAGSPFLIWHFPGPAPKEWA